MKLFSLLCLLLITLHANSQAWSPSAEFPGIERDDGASFTLRNVSYCGTGVVPFYTLKDFYAFNMVTETWSTIAPMPADKQRQYACGFSSEDMGYIFGGINDTAFIQDLWQYNPINNSWTEKTNLPGVGRGGAASFVIDSLAYIVGGKTDSLAAISEVWAYNMNSDSWIQKKDFPFGNRWRSASTASDSLGYIAFGLDGSLKYNSGIYSYNPSLDQWIKITDHPEGGRNYTKLFFKNNQLINFGGMDSTNSFLNECLTYNLKTNRWTTKSSLPSMKRRGVMSFQNQSAIFITTGLTAGGQRTKETWRLENPTSLESYKSEKQLKLYPNPVSEALFIQFSSFHNLYQYYIYNIHGGLVLTNQIDSLNSVIAVDKLAAGTYFLMLRTEGGFKSSLFIKN